MVIDQSPESASVFKIISHSFCLNFIDNPHQTLLQIAIVKADILSISPDPFDPAAPPTAEPLSVLTGYVDFYGYHTGAGGWVLNGWISPLWQTTNPTRLRLLFETGEVEGACQFSLFPRDDVDETLGKGVLIFVQASARTLGALIAVTTTTQPRLDLLASNPVHCLRNPELSSRAASYLPRLEPGPAQLRLGRLLARRGYQGNDTTDTLRRHLRIEFDHQLLCPPDGLILMGWCLAEPDFIRAITLRNGALAAPVDLATAIPINRPDVAASIGAEMGLPDPACGFILYVPACIAPETEESDPYLEIETSTGKIAYRKLHPTRTDPMSALERLLAEPNLQFAALSAGFDRHLGPAITALNSTRLAHPPQITLLDFGPQPTDPRVSIIITLYGRLDFFEVQMALASATAQNRATEFIYVLDEPARSREAEDLALSVFERFALPFRLVLLSANQGYGPANNIGLNLARGAYVCFLNSDIFPGSPLWIDELADHLAANPTLGAVGPLLLFEDGSVQHEGIGFERLPRFANWSFPIHPRKALRPLATQATLRPQAAITGACLMMRTALARDLGGFDPDYAIGDFEDVDLCLRITQTGQTIALAPQTWLYHLERQSQIAPDRRWRMNLTLYNAWRFNQSWATHPSLTGSPA